MGLTRRQFLGMSAAATALTIVPRHVLAGSGQTPPSEKLNIAGVGIGGQGYGDLMSVSSENIVALCDVDDHYAARAYQEWINACKGGPKPGSHFEHAAVLAEVVQLGNVAIRAGRYQPENGHPVKLLWDGVAGKVTNLPEANRYLQTEYRKGWETLH